jgi:hypothetical protein
MKLRITMEVDGTEEQCDAMLEELDTVREDSELIMLITSGGSYEVTLLQIEQPPAVGRHKQDSGVHPDQLALPWEVEA